PRALQLLPDLRELGDTEVPALGLLDVELDALHDLEEAVVVDALVAVRVHASPIGHCGEDLSGTRSDRAAIASPRCGRASGSRRRRGARASARRPGRTARTSTLS